MSDDINVPRSTDVQRIDRLFRERESNASFQPAMACEDESAVVSMPLHRRPIREQKQPSGPCATLKLMSVLLLPVDPSIADAVREHSQRHGIPLASLM